MKKDLDQKILKKIEKQLTRMLLVRQNKALEINIAIEKSAKTVLKYIKKLQSKETIISEHDETILECLLLKYHSLVLPIVFSLFSLWFSASFFNALINTDYYTAIYAFIFTLGIIVLARLLINSQTKEIFEYSLVGVFLGLFFPFMALKVDIQYSIDGLWGRFCYSFIELDFKTIFAIGILVWIIAFLEIDLRVTAYFKRNNLRRVYEIYMHHQKRIDEVANCSNNNE